MRAVVVGAGAWGLPAAAELARRGHRVTVLDRYGVGNPLSSSGGPTRLWRIADPDLPAVRLGRRAVEAMDRLESSTGRTVYRRLGLLWRDDSSLDRVRAAAVAEGVEHDEVDAADVGRRVPGLRADGRAALWFPDAGSVLAAESLAAARQLLDRHEGALLVGRTVVAVVDGADGVRVELDDGSSLAADVCVLAPGPGAPALLTSPGLQVPLRPYLEQVVHVGDRLRPTAYDDWPCLFDGPTEDEPGIYTMPTPGVGYKIGFDDPLRPLEPDDDDRRPDARLTAAVVARVRRDLTGLPAEVVDELVCSWTDSPDGWFVVDRVGSVVVACGDSGKGFKYFAVMAELLADLTEGSTPDAEAATMSLARFADLPPVDDWRPTRLGGT